MEFKLTPFVEILKMGKEQLDAVLAPVRARLAKSRFDGEIARLQEKLLTAQAKIPELCAEKEINVSKLMDQMDDIALTERRIEDIKVVRDQLFPESAE